MFEELKMTEIQQILFKYQDQKYADFISKLVPTVPKQNFIGIRSPVYKKIIKEINENLSPTIIENFLKVLPHKYHEENCLHVNFINNIKDYDEYIRKLELFLPYIDNWAVSDSLGAKILEKNPQKLIEKIHSWIQDEKPYTKRVAMLFLKKYYLNQNFSEKYLQWASKIRTDEYYVNMMTAWLFADALVYQWDTAIKFLQEQKLDTWTHNKIIQKARESFRITPEQKEYLKTLKRK